MLHKMAETFPVTNYGGMRLTSLYINREKSACDIEYTRVLQQAITLPWDYCDAIWTFSTKAIESIIFDEM